MSRKYREVERRSLRITQVRERKEMIVIEQAHHYLIYGEIVVLLFCKDSDSDYFVNGACIVLIS